MAIKVITHWPTKSAEVQQLQESLAKATLIVLKKMFADKGLGAADLDVLMKKIKNERLKA